jgi:hypothetical protein
MLFVFGEHNDALILDAFSAFVAASSACRETELSVFFCCDSLKSCGVELSSECGVDKYEAELGDSIVSFAPEFFKRFEMYGLNWRGGGSRGFKLSVDVVGISAGNIVIPSFVCYVLVKDFLFCIARLG